MSRAGRGFTNDRDNIFKIIEELHVKQSGSFSETVPIGERVRSRSASLWARESNEIRLGANAGTYRAASLGFVVRYIFSYLRALFGLSTFTQSTHSILLK